VNNSEIHADTQTISLKKLNEVMEVEGRFRGRFGDYLKPYEKVSVFAQTNWIIRLRVCTSKQVNKVRVHQG